MPPTTLNSEEPSNLDVMHQLGSITPVKEHYTTSEVV